MKLLFSPTSPFVRKCFVAAIELGIDDQMELVPAAAHPIHRSQDIVRINPLGKVPVLLRDDGIALYDSRVICEYLDVKAGGSLHPRDTASRWKVLAQQALADGILDAALLARYESAVRPQELHWAAWTTAQLDKARSGVRRIDQTVDELGPQMNMGTIATAVALAYLDFRFEWLDWRADHPAAAAWYESIAARPSMRRTVPRVSQTG